MSETIELWGDDSWSDSEYISAIEQTEQMLGEMQECSFSGQCGVQNSVECFPSTSIPVGLQKDEILLLTVNPSYCAIHTNAYIHHCRCTRNIMVEVCIWEAVEQRKRNSFPLICDGRYRHERTN